ncbi:MAG: phosphopantothenate/pantothenate synthetase [Candidatus Lokiarchaeota archaeon]|nr:phosphopantothenate/pantothenate synthetase [Candidatus Lokiarchaeota archaeon]
MEHIPKNHPRADSLRTRQRIIDGLHENIVIEAGLIAHGRGEAFDYLIGERTNDNAMHAIEVAVAALFSAKHAVISVNGNVAALCAEEIVRLSKITGALLEINLFYGKPGRIEAISKTLRDAGADNILGIIPFESSVIHNLSSNRRFVDPKGIKIADTVLVPLEDGDRTEALKEEGKRVITIDLNPLSRTAQQADITIVDNIIRVIPRMCEIAKDYKQQLDKNKLFRKELQEKVIKWDNAVNLSNAMMIISTYLESKVSFNKN